MRYCNYHKHSDYSNIMTPDCSVSNKDYAKRLKELGHRIFSCAEHGYQGNYFEVFKLCKEYNLKFIYGAEAYWVKDRFEKDRTNSHICVFAKTDKGRKALNLALSEANITGYYFKPRLDLDLLLSLPPDDIFLTSACVAFWKYDDIEEIILKLHNHFKNNFKLEVQYHNTPLQKEINKKILNISKKYKIDIIAGMDSHYIDESQHDDREQVLLSKNIRYEEEDGWYLDFPDYNTAFNRFKEQGVLNENEISTSLKNTLIFETNEFEDLSNIFIFQEGLKLPSLYKKLSQQQKDDKLKGIIDKEWNIYKETIAKEDIPKYEEEIKREFKIITDTRMADYFLLDYEIVKDAVANGGEITTSGRGSCVSMFINTLLGFSKIDRISAKVKMFPERFMSVSRILESGTSPDIDMNLGNPEVFAEAQKRKFGEHNSYPMIAYDEFGEKSAWKMYAKAKEIDFQIANDISQQLSEYTEAKKYASDEEKEFINVLDFIDAKYYDIFKHSEVYHGIKIGKKAHPCAWLILDRDIREEIGLIRAVSESTKKSTIVSLMDGLSAEKFGYLKNDLLKVDVVKLAYSISRKIGKPIPTERELISLCHNNKKVWDIYAKGYTVGVNQVEKASTTNKAMRYKPSNIEELCAFIAAIRPSFMSMYKIFESRKKFEYGIPTFDKIIQDTGLESSFILYQETIMAVLSFAGFAQDKTYDIIKAISKKRKEKIEAIKPVFIKNFKEKIIEQDNMSEKEAQENVEKIWTIIENSSQYGFNASHSYSYAYDSLLCAYYKSHYPLEFYQTLLEEYTKKGNKNKVSLLRKEMQQAFGISVQNIKFRNDNTCFSIDKNKNVININMASVKGIGQSIADDFMKIKDCEYQSFTRALKDIVDKKIADKSKISTLIKLDYFSEFGSISKLLKCHENFFENKIYSKKTAKKDNLIFDEKLIKKFSTKETEKQYSGVDYVSILEEIEQSIPNKENNIKDMISYQLEFLGELEIKYGEDKYRCVVVDKRENKFNTKIDLYSLATGGTVTFKIRRNDYVQDFEIGDILNIKKCEKKYKVIPRRGEDGEIIRNKKGNPKHYDKTEEKEWILNSYFIEE